METVTVHQASYGATRRSARALWGLVATTLILGLLLLPLESPIEGRAVPNHVSSEAFVVSSYEELLERSGPVCSRTGEILLADTVECRPFDGHGGLLYVIAMTLLAAAGGTLVTRFHNPIGWLLVIGPLVDVGGASALAYSIRGTLVEPGSLPASRLVAVVPSVSWIVLLVLIVPRLLMTIPDGRIRSDRWRWGLGFTHAVAAILIIIALFHPLLAGSIPNPIALPWTVATADSFFGIAVLGMLVSWGIALSALLVRIIGGLRAKLVV